MYPLPWMFRLCSSFDSKAGHLNLLLQVYILIFRTVESVYLFSIWRPLRFQSKLLKSCTSFSVHVKLKLCHYVKLRACCETIKTGHVFDLNLLNAYNSFLILDPWYDSYLKRAGKFFGFLQSNQDAIGSRIQLLKLVASSIWKTNLPKTITFSLEPAIFH